MSTLCSGGVVSFNVIHYVFIVFGKIQLRKWSTERLNNLPEATQLSERQLSERELHQAAAGDLLHPTAGCPLNPALQH